MPTYCSAYNCKNYNVKNSGLSFHMFPKDPELRKIWVVATKRKGFVPSKTATLCSAHFEDDCFEVGGLRRMLKPNAVPTLFDFPQHLQQHPPKRRRVIKKIQDKGTNANSLVPEDNNVPSSPSTPPVSPKKKKQPVYTPTKNRLRRKVKILQQRLKRRDYKIRTMKELLSVLEKKLKAPERLVEVLQNNFSGFPLHLLTQSISNNKKNKHGFRYSEQMKEFALTLYFYSPKAYSFLRKQGFFLPNPSTLRGWLSAFKCAAGFLNEVFAYLKANVESRTYLKDVNLVFDCMSIRKQLIYDPTTGTNLGYTDLGLGIKVDDHEKLATEALVFQVVSLKGNFKCCIAYFLIDGMNANVLSQLIKTAILKLHDVGVKVHNTTCDGTSTNISAFQKLGCKLPDKAYFKIKGISHNICVMLDACHMLKLARNTLADKKIIVSGNGKEIAFKYIERLLSLQTELGLKLVNKLTHAHVFYRNKKMNVRLAVQMLSNSVANALQFLSDSKHPDFVGCEETVKFLRTLNDLFDFFNTRTPFGRHFKDPIHENNFESCKTMLQNAYDYLSTLNIEGVNILKHARKTFVLGFLTNINAMNILSLRLLKELRFKYVLTYKFSQDHLELFFSCIRARGGRNNNPNVNQFKFALRQLMYRNSVRASDGSNCLEFDENHQNAVLSFHVPLSLDENVDDDGERDAISELQDMMSNLIDGSELSYYKDNILYYISGFVVRKVNSIMKCAECTDVLYSQSSLNSDGLGYDNLTSFVSNGHLIHVSQQVFKLIKYLYNLFLASKDSANFCTKNCIVLASRHFHGCLFSNHIANIDFSDDSHELKLIKHIGAIFYKTICFAHTKDKTMLLNKSKLGMRQKLNKLVLFTHM